LNQEPRVSGETLEDEDGDEETLEDEVDGEG